MEFQPLRLHDCECGASGSFDRQRAGSQAAADETFSSLFAVRPRLYDVPAGATATQTDFVEHRRAMLAVDRAFAAPTGDNGNRV